MTRTLPDPILERLERVRGLEQRILEQTRQLHRDGMPYGDRDQPAAAVAVATLHLRALDELARRRQTDLSSTNRDIAVNLKSASFAAEEILLTVEATIAAYGALYSTGRLLFESEIADDLAYPHGEEWRDQVSTLADWLVSEVHADLLADGFTCRCVCPACGMGACLCTRNSTATVRELFARPEAEPGEGIELRVPPRPGSEMARIGLTAGDLIVRVDGEVVRTNADLQGALRGHEIGDPIPMEVDRSGRREEVRAARVSDLP